MNRIETLVELGKRIKTSPVLQLQIELAGNKNPWFTTEFVQQAISAICDEMLTESKLKQWLDKYDLHEVNKTAGLVFAGNIPLVGFHDFLCCYVTGCKMKIKLSSKDDTLFMSILDILFDIDPAAKAQVEIVETLKDFDAVIATGSDNTNRHFEYYFRKYPKILRKNRNAIAILTGEETSGQLDLLADDIFMYFGFGCRNVSKVFVPVGYDVTTLFPHFEKYKWMHQHTKYMNNYDYNRTLLLLNKTPHFSNDYIMLKESETIPSPISTLYYQSWHDERVMNSLIKQNTDKIQCVVSAQPERWPFASSVTFGQSQHPELWDYADGVDTIRFLLSL
jgi:Acyl-CoA reductase (LuxC)